MGINQSDADESPGLQKILGAHPLEAPMVNSRATLSTLADANVWCARDPQQELLGLGGAWGISRHPEQPSRDNLHGHNRVGFGRPWHILAVFHILAYEVITRSSCNESTTSPRFGPWGLFSFAY